MCALLTSTEPSAAQPSSAPSITANGNARADHEVLVYRSAAVPAATLINTRENITTLAGRRSWSSQ